MKFPALSAFVTHLKRFREIYLFPLVGIFALYWSIRLVNHLTGRAVVDDPGAIIGGLYNAILVLVALAITGAVQGFILPDVDEDKQGLPWQTHLINCLCTLVFFALVCFFIFR